MKIGDILREAREAKNYTLEEIQVKTKIQKRYLIEIENNNFAALPGRFYARAFVKEYAQILGLDGVRLMEDLGEEEFEEDKETAVQYSRLKRTKRAGMNRGTAFFNFLPTLIVLMLFLGIGYIAYTLIAEKVQNNNSPKINEIDNENDKITRDPILNQDPDDEQDDEEEEEPEPEEIEEEPVIPDPSFTVLEEGTGTSPLSTMQLIDAPETIEITLIPTERVYAEVRGESEVYIGEILNADMEAVTFDISAEEKVYINVGFAPGLDIEINGIEFEYPTDISHAVHQRVWLHLTKELEEE